MGTWPGHSNASCHDNQPSTRKQLTNDAPLHEMFKHFLFANARLHKVGDKHGLCAWSLEIQCLYSSKPNFSVGSGVTFIPEPGSTDCKALARFLYFFLRGRLAIQSVGASMG